MQYKVIGVVSNAILIVIAIGVFFAGVGVSYAIFSNTYDPNTMRFANQELFDQMISNNPKMTASWMDSMMTEEPELMLNQMNEMMNDPKLRIEMMDMMSGMMGSNMQGQSSMMNSGITGDSMMTMPFNANAPITIPMIDGYYKGEKVYFVHTEVSDANMANMMSMMINFPTLHVTELKNISQENMAKVYVFTNGISGSGPYGGGPFMFQIDVFDSIPDQAGYNQFRVPHLVTWNDGSAPRLLTSVEEILEAEANGELMIQKTDNVVNAPMIVWRTADGIQQKAATIKNIFKTMPDFEGEVTQVDIENYSVTLRLHQSSKMDMMN